MPYPSRLSKVQIVAEGRALLEEGGRQGLTMRALARLAGGLWSLVHGYTVLKLAAQFRLDPDPESSFAFALDTLLQGAALAGRAPAR